MSISQIKVLNIQTKCYFYKFNRKFYTFKCEFNRLKCKSVVNFKGYHIKFKD